MWISCQIRNIYVSLKPCCQNIILFLYQIRQKMFMSILPKNIKLLPKFNVYQGIEQKIFTVILLNIMFIENSVEEINTLIDSVEEINTFDRFGRRCLCLYCQKNIRLLPKFNAYQGLEQKTFIGILLKIMCAQYKYNRVVFVLVFLL